MIQEGEITAKRLTSKLKKERCQHPRDFGAFSFSYWVWFSSNIGCLLIAFELKYEWNFNWVW